MKRTIPTIVALFSLLAAIYYSYSSGESIPIVNIAGGFFAFFIIVLTTYKMPLHFYYSCLLFYILASPMGTILNFYRTIGCYDRIVHYFSGIILADLGVMIIMTIYENNRVLWPSKQITMKRLFVPIILFSLFFSMSCAALWEIYEFTADQLIGTTMQGNNLNTMGDIVSGVLGGLTYTIFYRIKNYKHLK